MEQVRMAGRYAPRDGSVLARQVANEMVIVDMHNGIYHGLNAVGAQIWEELDGQRTLSEVAATLEEAYPDVERVTIEADIVALVQALLDNDLVVAR